MRITLSYEQVRAGINAAPNTPAGVRLCGRLVDTLTRVRWPVTVDLSGYELAAMRAAGMLPTDVA